MALISLFAGTIGWLLRRQEVATIFDPYTGLAERGAPITAVLIVASLIIVALLFGLSFTVPKERTFSSFSSAFGGKVLGTVILAILGLIVLALAGLQLVSLTQTADGLDPFSTVRLLAALLAGLCLVLVAILGPRGTNVAIPATIPVFWLCIWLIVGHIDQAADPVLLGYVYSLFALAALLLALYYIAGYAFRQHHPRRLMFCSSTAIYFTGVTMGDNLPFYMRGTLLALAATVLIYQLTLSKNLTQDGGEDTSYAERNTDIVDEWHEEVDE